MALARMLKIARVHHGIDVQKMNTTAVEEAVAEVEVVEVAEVVQMVEVAEVAEVPDGVHEPAMIDAHQGVRRQFGIDGLIVARDVLVKTRPHPADRDLLVGKPGRCTTRCT